MEINHLINSAYVCRDNFLVTSAAPYWLLRLHKNLHFLLKFCSIGEIVPAIRIFDSREAYLLLSPCLASGILYVDGCLSNISLPDLQGILVPILW